MNISNDPVGKITEKIMLKCHDSIKGGANHQNRANYNVVFEAVYESIKTHQDAVQTMNDKWSSAIDRIAQLRTELKVSREISDKLMEEIADLKAEVAHSVEVVGNFLEASDKQAQTIDGLRGALKGLLCSPCDEDTCPHDKATNCSGYIATAALEATDSTSPWVQEAIDMQIVEYESRGQVLYAGLGAPASIRFIYDKLGKEKPKDLPSTSPWVKIDINDQSTWPEVSQFVFLQQSNTNGTIGQGWWEKGETLTSGVDQWYNEVDNKWYDMDGMADWMPIPPTPEAENEA